MMMKQLSARRMSTTKLSDYEKAVSRPSKLVYGSNNEHVNSEKLLLDAIGREGRTAAANVLTVCGGADNFMSILALERVSSVTCVDMNPHQLALGRLKLALACSDVPTEEALNFLGMNFSLDDNARRMEIYERIIEPELPEDVASLIRRDLMYEVERGVAQFGGEINGMRFIQRELAQLGCPPEDLWNGTVNLEKFKWVCRPGVISSDGIAKAMFLDESFLPDTYRKMWDEVCIPRTWSAITQAVADDAFERTFQKGLMLRGKYDMESLPEWLLPAVRSKLRKKKEQVTFVNSVIDDVPIMSENKFDLVSTSNIFDWIDFDAGVTTLTSISDNLVAPGGCILVRMAFSSPNDLSKCVPNVRPFKEVQPEQLAEVDYSHFWFHNPAGFAILRACHK